MSEKTCPRCRTGEVHAGDIFCTICGLDLRGGSDESEVNKVKCLTEHLTEQRVREIVQEELKAAAGMAAVVEQELQLLQIRKRRIKKRITDPEARQRTLAALEAHCCSLQSLLQQERHR